MDKIYEESLLYDFYGSLLTEKQQAIYEAVRFGDLSLSEAAGEFGISRQGIHDMLRRSEQTLEKYESTLGLVRQFEQMKELAGEIRKRCSELMRTTEGEQLKEPLSELAALAEKITV